MKINAAIQQSAEQGWLLLTEDTHQDKNGYERRDVMCQVYAVRDSQKIRLCSWSQLWLMSRAKFTALLAQLPREAGVA
jgi:hypothetical protein